MSTDDELRAAFWAPCDSKEMLHAWILKFLGVDFPDGIVTDDEIHAEPSNSSPMDFVWEVYDKAMRGDDWEFERVLAYSARAAGKTLAFAVIEVLALFHLRRSCAHMAAVESQAAKCAEYVDNFLNRPVLRDYRDGNNKRRMEIAWYESEDRSTIYPCKVFEKLLKSGEAPDSFVRRSYYLKVIVATMSGANCVDPQGLVATPDGFIKAGDILPGQSVVVFDTKTLSRSVARVRSISEAARYGIRLVLADGRELLLSEDHRIFTDDGWVAAADLIRNSKVFVDSATKPMRTCANLVVREDVVPVLNPRSVIVGTLLGDSSLTWPSSGGKRYGRACRLSCNHSDKQYQLLDQLGAALTALDIKHVIIDDSGSRKSPTKKLVSRTSVALNEFFELFYGHGKKRVTPEILALVDDEALAYWFMDDGSGGNGDPYRLATCGFSLEENQLIADWFRGQGLECSILDQTNQSKKIYKILRFTMAASRKITERIKRFVPGQLRYKLVPTDEQVRRYCVHCAKVVPASERWRGFRYCGCVSYNTNSPTQRIPYQNLRKQMVPIVSMARIGLQYFVDLTIDTENTGIQNYFVNGILSHNSEHVPLLLLDELDLAPEKPVSEALSIPTKTEDGKPPITLMTSTRKFGFGLVQKTLDEAKDTGLHVRHWNLIDVTQACPPERHRPEEPRQKLYYNTGSLRTIGQDDYTLLATDEQEKWYAAEGYAGCVSCPIFAGCRGRLATKQKSKAKFLKDVRETISDFKKRAKDPDYAKAQLLAWKPGSAGLIYPLLSPDLHFKTATQMATLLTGDDYVEEVSKTKLVEIMRSLGIRFFAGMDFGYTHAFAIVVAALWGETLYVVEVVSVTEFELGQKLELCEKVLKPYDATIFPDPAYPSDIKSFRRAGYRMVNFKKDVHKGISAVRAKVMPTTRGVPEIYFLAGDPMCELLFTQLSQYHWLLDAAGRPTDEPDDVDDDLPDALRYLAQNLFGNKIYKKIKQREPEAQPAPSVAEQAAAFNKRIMEDHMKLLTGAKQGAPGSSVYRKGSKFFSV